MTARRLARQAGPAAILAALVVVVVLVVACGGGSDSPDPGDSVVVETGSPSATASTPTVTASASSSSDGSSPSTSALPSSSPTAGSGNASVDLCAKLPAADVEAVVGVAGITARPEQGNTTAGYCSYLVGDRIVVATSYIAAGARQVFEVYAGTGEAVPGIADGAVWVQSTMTLFIRRSDSLMGIQVIAGPTPPEGVKAASILLGQTAAGRL